MQDILSWKNLSMKVKNTDRYLMCSLSGQARSKEILCVMGPSGAGKSSFLSVASGRYSQNFNKFALQGEMSLNGRRMSNKQMQAMTAFVRQDDILLSTMTVEETLQFQCNLKLFSISQQQRNTLVEKMIRKLGLEGCRKSLVGGQFLKSISGGERKRLAIGVELISDPKCLVLDQPTSGLDSHIAYKTFILLKQLAQQGKIIIAAIHQPSSIMFKSFDKLMILNHGETIYLGKANLIVPYMQSLSIKVDHKMNPCDFLMMQISKDKDPQKYTTRLTPKNFLESSFNQIEDTQLEQVKIRNDFINYQKEPAPFEVQFKCLLKRSFRSFYRTPSNIIGKSVGMIIFPLIMSTLFYDLGNQYKGFDDFDALRKFFSNITAFLFNVSFFALAKNLYDTLLSFTSQKQITLKEVSSNLYNMPCYFCCRCMIELPVGIILLLFTTPIVYWIAALAPEAAIFFRYIAVLLLMSLIGYMLGLLIGILFSTGAQAAQVVPIFIIPISLFGGLLVNLRTIPSYVSWLQYLSPLRHCYSFLMQDQLSSSKFDNIGQYDQAKQLAGINGSMSLDFLWLIVQLLALSFLSILNLYRRVNKL